MIRIRMVRPPPILGIDGIRLDCFEVGKEYEVGNSIGALFLAEAWAVPVAIDEPRPYTPFDHDDPFDSRVLYQRDPPNLVKDKTPPWLDRASAADFQYRRRGRRKR